MQERELICIGCPRGCVLRARISAEGSEISGNACRQGVTYARQELTDPRRVLTTTVRVIAGKLPVVPVRSAAPLPKERIPQALAELRCTCVEAPVGLYQVIIPSVAGTGIAVIATWPVERVALGEPSRDGRERREV